MSIENSYDNVRTSDSVAHSIPAATPSPNATSAAAAPPPPPALDAELVEIADCLGAQLRECQANSLCWLLKAGTYLLDTRRELEPGEWTRLFVSARLPFGLRTAQTLARIAENAALSHARNLGRLPTSISALDELAGLEPASIEQGICDGTIQPEMTAASAKAFVRQHRQQKQQQT